MWRFCDLHVHTTPNEQTKQAWDAGAWVAGAINRRLDVVAVTDHDHIEHITDAQAAASSTANELTVVPGVELSTDRGHVILLAPGETGSAVLGEFMLRIGARPGHQVGFDDLTATVSGRRSDGSPFAQHVVTIGAHVDMEGSLLAANNPLSLDGQIHRAESLHALEVCKSEVVQEWGRSGIKQTGAKLTLLQGSDRHRPDAGPDRATWLYLPQVTVSDLRHAFAVAESSVSLTSPPPSPQWAIESVSFSGGHHGDRRFEFCERTNALIGPPNSGKSLIIDALKFAFGVACDIPEVESTSLSRMQKCLPPGTMIEVGVRTPDGLRVISRTVGGSAPPRPPFRPIIFSQTELTRRGMATTPAIALLDLHVPGVDELKQDLAQRAQELEQVFSDIIPSAREARRLRDMIMNPQDGLEATTAELGRLVGTEEVASRATQTLLVAQWRLQALQAVGEWARSMASPASIVLPPKPQTTELLHLVPDEQLRQVARSTDEIVESHVRTAKDRMQEILSRDEAELKRLQAELYAELQQAGFEGGSEVASRLDELRRRVGDLETIRVKLAELDAKIESGIVQLREKLSLIERSRHALTRARRAACTAVNASMRTFFARVDPNGVTERLDGLIEDLKTGTYMRTDTRHRIRESLDRPRVLERAIRQLQGLPVAQSSVDDQDRITDEAIARSRHRDIARLACLWPGDALLLEAKTTPPTPFSQLTEGLRSLAVKEISFAASDLPVVSDQPEDAVPTRAVFESLVPTLRQQRLSRQFIVASHDANIVVASDTDRVCALASEEDGSPHTGSLFDPTIRRSALEHLEGGRAAFELRAARYRQLS